MILRIIPMNFVIFCHSITTRTCTIGRYPVKFNACAFLFRLNTKIRHYSSHTDQFIVSCFAHDLIFMIFSYKHNNLSTNIIMQQQY